MERALTLLFELITPFQRKGPVYDMYVLAGHK